MAATSLSDFSPLPLRLKETLDACSIVFQTEDLANYEESVSSLITILDSLLEITDPSSEVEVAADEALVELHRYLSSHPNQVMADALSLELPKVLAKFASMSHRVSETVGSIVDFLVSVCSPRDMLPILSEALYTQINVSKEPITYIPFLNGLSKVFLGIQRHPLKQVKEVLPVIIRVLNDVSSEFNEETKDSLHDIFDAAVSIGTAIETICQKLVERSKEELCAILGLYALQNIAFITRSRQADIVSGCGPLIIKFSQFLPFCGLSYLGLITGEAVVSKERGVGDGDDFMANFSLVRDGSSLAVLWGYVSDEVAKAAGEELTAVLDNIRNNRSKRWQAVGILSCILSSIDYNWEVKSRSIELLLTLMDRSHSENSSDNDIDISSFIPSLFVTLQAIQRIMIGASDASLRKKAFDALRKVIQDLPCSERFDILKALISNSNSPSMIAILIGLFKDEFLLENRQKRMTISPFWSSDALDLVELVLKPPKGGPPSLPEDIEPVLAALNLYRFILLIESSGKSNYTGVLSEKTLRKAYSEWLLPLRALVSGIQAENEKDGCELAEDILCGLNPVQLVLYRCIELVEENLKCAK